MSALPPMDMSTEKFNSLHVREWSREMAEVLTASVGETESLSPLLVCSNAPSHGGKFTLFPDRNGFVRLVVLLIVVE